MAVRKYTKKSTKKKTYKKRTYKKRPQQKSIVNLGTAFPKKVMATLKYSETLQLYSTTGALSKYFYNMNGLYDTNQTGGGHAPMYWNQFITIWRHYTVIGAKMTVKFLPIESNTMPIRAVLTLSDDATMAPTTIDGIEEQTQSKGTIISSGGNSPLTVLTLNWSAKKTFGGSVLGNDQLQGSSTSNPVELSTGCISIQSADGITSTTCIAVVNIEYITIFDELFDHVQS